MNCRNVWIASATLLGVAALPTNALAQGPWGTPEEAAPCLDARDAQPCKAEIARRAQNCLHDPNEAENIAGAHSGRSKAAGDAAALDFCVVAATHILDDQLEDLAARKKEADARRAKLESTELPEAKQHNAKLEQAVIAAYIKGGYKDNKVLKVILGDWSTDYEKDAFGRITGHDLWATVVNKHPDGKCELFSELWLQLGNGRSWSGPLSERGAGSLETAEILCSKVEAAAKPKKK